MCVVRRRSKTECLCFSGNWITPSKPVLEWRIFLALFLGLTAEDQWGPGSNVPAITITNVDTGVLTVTEKSISFPLDMEAFEILFSIMRTRRTLSPFPLLYYGSQWPNFTASQDSPSYLFNRICYFHSQPPYLTCLSDSTPWLGLPDNATLHHYLTTLQLSSIFSSITSPFSWDL